MTTLTICEYCSTETYIVDVENSKGEIVQVPRCDNCGTNPPIEEIQAEIELEDG